jgi:hypothetical protein
MCENRVVYYEKDSHFRGDYVWTMVYGDELLNFMQTYDERTVYSVEAWRVTGEKRLVYRPLLDNVLACFPLEYQVQYV